MWDKPAPTVVTPAPANGWTWWTNDTAVRAWMPSKDCWYFDTAYRDIKVIHDNPTSLQFMQYVHYREITVDEARAAFSGKTFDSQLGPRP
jgi:hypothetical protein